jgi:hypothetical protein
MRTALLVFFATAIISCNNNNSTGSRAAAIKIDTVAVLKGHQWKIVSSGTDANKNGIPEPNELTVHTAVFPVLTFGDNGYMTDTMVYTTPPHSTGTDGYWRFTGPNKSQIYFSEDSVGYHNCTIKNITDSTLNLYLAPNYWWICKKYTP